LPLVVQFNKRDLSNTLSRDDLLSRWGSAPWPLVFSVALTGHGVLTTFKQLLVQVYTRMDDQYKLSQNHGMECSQFVKAIMGDVSFVETER
jgi:hypothetical protein